MQGIKDAAKVCSIKFVTNEENEENTLTTDRGMIYNM